MPSSTGSAPAPKQTRNRAAALTFLAQFLRDPKHTGAIAPSSPALTRLMLEWFDLGSAGVVVEYGPGTGSFTESILKRCGSATRYLGLEINPELVEHLRRRFPEAQVLCRSAGDVEAGLLEMGAASADLIVSGLPWSVFPASEQDAILAATARALRPGGGFATFAYLQGLLLPGARHFRRKLNATFSSVRCSRVAWLNLPPAFVYRCTK